MTPCIIGIGVAEQGAAVPLSEPASASVDLAAGSFSPDAPFPPRDTPPDAKGRPCSNGRGPGSGDAVVSGYTVSW
jgi:hypothetical protein